MSTANSNNYLEMYKPSADHNALLESNTNLLETREKELAALRKKANKMSVVDADTAKKIARYEEIVKNIKDTIQRIQYAMSLKRPYGM